MECRKAQDRMSDFRDGTLDPLEAVAVAAHLMRCGECAAVAESLDAVRLRLRGLPLAPAPPELLPRILAAVEAERGSSGAASGPAGTGARRSFLARFRVPIEAAAAVLLIASVYWYQRTPPPVSAPPPVSIAQAPKSAPRPDVSRDVSPDVSRDVPAMFPPMFPEMFPPTHPPTPPRPPLPRPRPRARVRRRRGRKPRPRRSPGSGPRRTSRRFRRSVRARAPSGSCRPPRPWKWGLK